jgi:hypothetical protein
VRHDGGPEHRRKPIIPGWKTVAERENKKPGPRTEKEIAEAEYGYGQIKEEAKALVAKGVKRGWLSFGDRRYVEAPTFKVEDPFGLKD